MLSSEHNVTCCFPIPHHAFSQFEIDSSGSQRESGKRGSKTLWLIQKQYVPLKAEIYHGKLQL